MAADILQERAQKYGRNVTIAAGTILVLAWVPGIDIDKFKPLGFDISESPSAELSFWCILFGVLAFYFVRFSISLRIDYLDHKTHMTAHFSARRNMRSQRRTAIEHSDADDLADAKAKLSTTRWNHNEICQFYILDAGLPVGLFVLAAVATVMQISAL